MVGTVRKMILYNSSNAIEYKKEQMEGLPVETMVKMGTVKFFPSICSGAYNSVYTDTHTHGKVLWFQLLGTSLKGMPTQGRIELNFLWNLFLQCPRLM
jgi:hypothetical protein